MIWIFKILFIFVSLSFTDRAEMPTLNEGFFYSLKSKDVAPPCIDHNGLYSPVEGLSKGKGGIPCLLPPHKLFIMLKNSTGAFAQKKAISAKKILKHLLIFDDVPHFRKMLQTTTIETIIRDDDEESRCEVYNYFIAVDDFFEKLEQYQNQQNLINDERRES